TTKVLNCSLLAPLHFDKSLGCATSRCEGFKPGTIALQWSLKPPIAIISLLRAKPALCASAAA
ncbi:MAG: hypothetical protein QNJ29_01795, partial [Rhizobiaceae bacterium]|nr:hypothetical protein [Rhizobiaceae bacterium]